MSRRRSLLALAALLLGCGGARAAERFHDPSTIVQCKDDHWIFSTGLGLKSWHSKDLVHWEPGPRVLETSPAWWNEVVPGQKGYLWAPDCIQTGGRYLLYYSVSGWGKNTSAIGLASNPTLDPADPRYHWTDEGIVVQSRAGDRYNAIDPSLMLAPDGRLWLAFGSFWAGIELAELDPASGKRRDGPLSVLAYHKQIEAPCLISRGGYYYLFMDWGFCCRGDKSTYEIRVGRSRNVAGPYLDRQGTDLRFDGGSLFLGNEGPRIGPGHAALFQEADKEWFSYHYYDSTSGGAATLGVRRLAWDAEGWPVAGEIAR